MTGALVAMNLPFNPTGEVAAIMLRITTQEGSAAITLLLEGKCRGPWVEELERCWRKTAASLPGKKLRVDLENVGFVDERGKELLRKMYAAGVELDAAGLMMASLVEEIVADASPRSRRPA